MFAENKKVSCLQLWGIVLLSCMPLFSFSQDFNTNKPEFKGAAYLDLFYGFDFNKPAGGERLPYLYHYNRHNEFNLNHGLIAVQMDHPRYRANLSFQAGTYVSDNYASESNVIKHIFDANAGFAINKANNLWIDVGIFGNSWIGIESTLGYTNWAVSRSILSENVPYYMAGAKISYHPGSRWLISGLVVNGWQRIARVPGNSLPGFGTQVSYEVDQKLTVNWSTFAGSDDPDSTRRMRFFNNFYAIWQLNHGWGVTLGGDYGVQQQQKNSSNMYDWYGLVAMLRKSWTESWSTTIRYEFYSDPENVIVSTEPGFGYRTSGLSANMDYKIMDKIICRLEGRWFNSPNNIYPKNNDWVSNNFFLLATVSVVLYQD